MDFFFGRNSGNSSRSVFALYEAAAAFRAHDLDVARGMNRTTDYLAINPMGKPLRWSMAS
jgi:glutathione S-transferase